VRKNAASALGCATQIHAQNVVQIFDELPDKGHPPLSLLFGFHDTASDLPVGGHHERVHAPSGSASGSMKQRDNIVANFVLFRCWPYSNSHPIR
jgi:hypothetical protein